MMGGLNNLADKPHYQPLFIQKKCFKNKKPLKKNDASLGAFIRFWRVNLLLA